MFCIRCGKQNDNENNFCTDCGTNLETGELTDNNLQQSIIKKENGFLKFLKNNKKKILLISAFIIIVLFLIIIYSLLFSFKKLNWNNEYEDINLEYVTQNEINLGINFSDYNKLNDLKIKTTCGTYERNGYEINWDLSDSLGECKIEVSYKLKKISKKYTVIGSNMNEKDLTIEHIIDNNSDEDLDLDGLTNKEENKYGTNPELSDTDMDGLIDYYEINVSKTDPIKEDTDSDGLYDYDEIELGLDPLKEDSKGDGIKDGERELTYILGSEETGIEIEINGTGNISSTSVNTYINDAFTDKNGVLDTVYNFYTNGKLDSATVKINYSLEEIQNKGLNEDNLTLYYFDDNTKKLELVPTIIDKDKKIIISKLEHFSKYIIGDSSVVMDNDSSQIMMVIDNSVSMYTYDQVKNLGYEEIQGADGNDQTFKRLTLTNSLIDMFTGDYYFGVSHFAGSYINIEDFTNNKNLSKKAVNSIKNNIDDLADGTDIVNALTKSIQEFDDDEFNHYLILMTDGKDTSKLLNEKRNSIISQAKDRNVKIFVIGLGLEIDTDELYLIATETGGLYYNALDENALDEIYALIGSDINYNLVDVDGDNSVDGTVIADSGFIVTRDGFSFPNYESNLAGGHCYGMATFAEMYYLKQLPLEFESKEIYNGKFLDSEQSYPYKLKNTYFQNFDSLYDYKLNTNALKYIFDFNYFGEDMPKDLRKLEGNTLLFNDIYKKEIDNSNLYDLKKEISTLDAKTQMKKWGVTYKDCENVLLNEDKMQTSSIVNNEDKQLLNAIYMSYIKQDDTPKISSGFSFLDEIKNGMNLIEPNSFPNSKKVLSNVFIDDIIYRIKNGDVPVISSEFYGTGGHAINAISIVQDNDDANHYYIGVYDNNFPGEKRYVDMHCNKFSCVTKANNYYDGNNKPISMSESLMKDFEYYGLDYVQYVKDK